MGRPSPELPFWCAAAAWAASWIAPSQARQFCRTRWKANLESGLVLAARGEAGLANRGLLAGECARIWREAFWLRVDRGEARRSLRGAAFVLVCGMAALLGLGAVTGGFRNVRALFGPPLLPDSGNLMAIRYSGSADQPAGLPPYLVPFWREHSRRFQGMAAFVHAPGAALAWVTPDFFHLLGVRPAAGRWPKAGENEAIAVTHAAWRALAGAARFDGRKVQIAGRWFTVVGVLPQGFWCISRSAGAFATLDLATPAESLPSLVGAVGRLAPGATREQARQELFESATAAGIALPRYPEIRVFTAAPARALTGYLFGYAFALAIAAALVARGGPLPARRGWRPLAFLLAKLVPAGLLPWALWIEVSAPLSAMAPEDNLAGFLLGVISLAFWALGAVAILWCFLDQRYRCPECLQLLTMPVRLGSWSSVLDPPSTEMVCVSGHGSLFLPDSEDGAPERWTVMDSSWRDLFRK